jgi:hypothetical protein
MRAQQCNAIWRTTRPLSGPCLNGVLNWHRCRLIVRVLVSGRGSSPRLSEKPDCRSDQRGCPADEVIATAAHCMSRMGHSRRFDHVRITSALPRKPTSIASGGMSQRCHLRTPALQKNKGKPFTYQLEWTSARGRLGLADLFLIQGHGPR